MDRDQRKCVYTKSTICRKVKKILRTQKEAISQSSACVGCDGPLVKVVGNTVPVAFYMCDGSLFEALVKPKLHGQPKTTFLFRVEEMYDDCTIKCRLIYEDNCHGKSYDEHDHNRDLDCLDQTIIIDLNCVCALQCFKPIRCYPCD